MLLIIIFIIFLFIYLGFDGATCAVDIDECENNDCENGECVDGVNDYKCMCYTGWTGQYCNVDKDECEDAPCKNGGICEQTAEPGNYVCTCTDEYKGKNCEDLKVPFFFELCNFFGDIY